MDKVFLKALHTTPVIGIYDWEREIRQDVYTNNSSFGLIETLAEHIAQIVREEFNVPWVRVTVHKPGAIEAAEDLGVTIERGKQTAH